MKITSFFARAAIAAGLTLSASASSNAAVLLNLIDPPPQTGTTYDLTFVATANVTTLSVGGYQVPSAEDVYYNSVTTGGGPNLLGGT